MKKGISYYFGYDVEPEERVKLIKQYGFDTVIANADKKFDYQNGKFKKQIKLFKKYGLELSSLHMSYNTKDLHYFWEDGKMGDKLTKKLIKDVKLAHKYGFSCVVVHLFGTYSQIGEQRLRKVLKVCEKLNVPLAIENIDCLPVFLETFKHISHPYLKFCYDSGHNNVFNKDYDYLDNFGDKLVALHLHDNNGLSDQHTLEKYGNIDWEKIAYQLADKNIVLDYEMIMVYRENESAIQCLKETKEMADRLEMLIEKAKLERK